MSKCKYIFKCYNTEYENFSNNVIDFDIVKVIVNSIDETTALTKVKRIIKREMYELIQIEEIL